MCFLSDYCRNSDGKSRGCPSQVEKVPTEFPARFLRLRKVRSFFCGAFSIGERMKRNGNRVSQMEKARNAAGWRFLQPRRAKMNGRRGSILPGIKKREPVVFRFAFPGFIPRLGGKDSYWQLHTRFRSPYPLSIRATLHQNLFSATQSVG